MRQLTHTVFCSHRSASVSQQSEVQWSLLSVRELQADEVEDFGSMRSREILDKLPELHLAVRLPCYIDYVNDFVATYMGDKYWLVHITSDSVTRES